MGLPFAAFGLEAKNLAERLPHVYFKVLPGEHQLAEDIRKIVTEMDNGRRIKALEQQNTELRMQVSQLESLLEERYHRTQSHILGIEQLLSQLNASILHSLLERSVTSPQEGK